MHYAELNRIAFAVKHENRSEVIYGWIRNNDLGEMLEHITRPSGHFGDRITNRFKANSRLLIMYVVLNGLFT